jgi:hypothetical protein
MRSWAHGDFPVLGIADVVPPSHLVRNSGADAVLGPSPSDVEEAENDVTALGIRYLTETEIARCVGMHALLRWECNHGSALLWRSGAFGLYSNAFSVLSLYYEPDNGFSLISGKFRFVA